MLRMLPVLRRCCLQPTVDCSKAEHTQAGAALLLIAEVHRLVSSAVAQTVVSLRPSPRACRYLLICDATMLRIRTAKPVFDAALVE